MILLLLYVITVYNSDRQTFVMMTQTTLLIVFSFWWRQLAAGRSVKAEALLLAETFSASRRKAYGAHQGILEPTLRQFIGKSATNDVARNWNAFRSRQNSANLELVETFTCHITGKNKSPYCHFFRQKVTRKWEAKGKQCTEHTELNGCLSSVWWLPSLV